MPKKYVVVCFLNFFVAALMGLMLRYFFVHPLDFNFRFLTHAHSHVAMLGWVYLMLFVLLTYFFVPVKKEIFNRLFWLTQVAVVGMMFSFPFQGYAWVSISFCTLHILCSYWFVYLVYKHHVVTSKITGWLLKASLVFMLLSTIGVWCLGPAVGLLGSASAFYQIAIQFFLHFQFNGWFLFAVLAIFVHQFPLQDSRMAQRFFIMLIVSTIFTFALPVSWFAFHPLLLWGNGLGVLLQVYTGYLFFQCLKPNWKPFWKQLPYLAKAAYGLALVSLLLKVALQFFSIIPEVAAMAYQYRNFVIGFIHLMMLGVISGFLLAFLFKFLVGHKSKTLMFGFYIFLAGFAATELFLLLQGLYYCLGWGMISHYHFILFLLSAFLPIGIVLIIFNLLLYESTTIETT